MLACFGGHLKVALQLHEQGASLDTKDNGGSCCLHWAVDGGKPGCVQWLLDNGIEVNRKILVRGNKVGRAGEKETLFFFPWWKRDMTNPTVRYTEGDGHGK